MGWYLKDARPDFIAQSGLFFGPLQLNVLTADAIVPPHFGFGILPIHLFYSEALFSFHLGLAGPRIIGCAGPTVTFGPRLGVNLSQFLYIGTPQQFDDVKRLAGVQVGATANIGFGNLAF